VNLGHIKSLERSGETSGRMGTGQTVIPAAANERSTQRAATPGGNVVMVVVRARLREAESNRARPRSVGTGESSNCIGAPGEASPLSGEIGGP
jgi:hypothetical protein